MHILGLYNADPISVGLTSPNITRDPPVNTRCDASGPMHIFKTNCSLSAFLKSTNLLQSNFFDDAFLVPMTFVFPEPFGRPFRTIGGCEIIQSNYLVLDLSAIPK